MDSKPVRFIVIGLWNTAFGYGAFILFEALLKPHYLWALTIAQAISIANAYFCHKRFVFKTDSMTWGEPLRFLLINGLNYGANLFVLPLLVNLARMTPVLAQGVTVTVLAVSNYAAHNYFTFRQKTAESAFDIEASIMKSSRGCES